MISSEAAKKFEEKLLKEKQKVEAEIKGFKSPADFGDDTDHGDEASDEAEENENNASIAETLETRIIDINSALEKIKSGAYGICEACNEPIEMEVLRVIPESRLCKNCKLSQ